MVNQARVQKVASQLKKLISLLLRSEIKDPKLVGTTITDIELSKDLSYAKIYYTISAKQSVASTTKVFDKSKGFFRSSIAKSLSLRIVPELKFIYDSSLDYGLQMQDKINKALSADLKMIKQSSQSIKQNYKNHHKESKLES